MNQAVTIIRQRVDASGVGEAEVSTAGPATTSSSRSRDRPTRRPATASRPPRSCSCGPCSYVRAHQHLRRRDDGKQTPYPTPDPSLQATPSAAPTNGSDTAWITPALQAAVRRVRLREPAANDPAAEPKDKPLITCDAKRHREVHPRPGRARTGHLDHRRGRADLQQRQPARGPSTSSSTTPARRRSRDQPAPLRADGAAEPVRVRARRQGALGPRDERRHPRRRPEHHRQLHAADSSKTLADQLKFGALPLSFKVQSQNTISATLGSHAAASGLHRRPHRPALVAIYSLFAVPPARLRHIASLVGAGAC